MDLMSIMKCLSTDLSSFFHQCLILYKSFTSLVIFIPKCFVLFDAIVNFYFSFQMIHCYCSETQLIFVCWFFYLAIAEFVCEFWQSLCVRSLGFPTYNIMSSVNRNNFTTSFSTSVQFSSVAQSCLTLCDTMNRSMPGLLVHNQLPESTQTHVHWVRDAIQPSYPLLSPSPSALNLSQHQGLFKWVRSSNQVAKVLDIFSYNEKVAITGFSL